ncbi:unnamed protein product [Sphagnum tenellum]
MAAEAGERSHEGGPQRSKTIMVRPDILRLPISDRPTAGQTRCVFRSGRRRVPDANNNGRCPILPSYYVLAYVQISFLLKVDGGSLAYMEVSCSFASSVMPFFMDLAADDELDLDFVVSKVHMQGILFVFKPWLKAYDTQEESNSGSSID